MPRTRTHFARLASLLGLAALGLAACGGGGSGSRSSKDEDAIRKIIVSTSTTKDPSRCATLATQRFLEQIEIEEGSKALAACRDDVKNDRPANSVDIASVKVSGTQATATYTQHGGDSDGQRFTVDFLKSEDTWRFDHISGLQIDRPKFERSMRASLVRPPDAISVSAADCSIRELRSVSDTEIESAVVDGEPAVLIRPVAVCAVIGELSKLDLASSVVTCTARKSIDSLSDDELVAATQTSGQTAVEKAIKRALDACRGSASATA
jgi:hypothetical protein